MTNSEIKDLLIGKFKVEIHPDFVLVDKTKRIRGIYNGTLMLEAQQVVKDINALLEE